MSSVCKKCVYISRTMWLRSNLSTSLCPPPSATSSSNHTCEEGMRSTVLDSSVSLHMCCWMRYSECKDRVKSCQNNISPQVQKWLFSWLSLGWPPMMLQRLSLTCPFDLLLLAAMSVSAALSSVPLFQSASEPPDSSHHQSLSVSKWCIQHHSVVSP